MTDLEINKALALAIGWTENRRDENGCLDPDVAVFGEFRKDPEVKVWDGSYWRTFDYRDPAVIWPIAKRYDCFPRQSIYLRGPPWVVQCADGVEHYAETSEKAVAIAVIGGAK